MSRHVKTFRSAKNRIFTFVVLLALLLALPWLTRSDRQPGPTPTPSSRKQTQKQTPSPSSEHVAKSNPAGLAEGDYKLERVVDGDTLLLSNRVRVRLIGIDTPETVKPNHPIEPWGPEASTFTKKFVANGTVRLQFDKERTDQYGRCLAYVWVGDRMLNEELLLAGLARAKTYYNYSNAVKDRYRRAEAKAKKAKRGIWSAKR